MIFLSASVPTPDREYYGTEDIFAIREAICAFTKVCAEYQIHFYFGGHPSITPMIWQVATQNSSRSLPLIEVYQSRYFGQDIPKEVSNFKHVHLTEIVDCNLWKSVMHMRYKMFTENETECAVFIGGMDGIISEYEMLKTIRPHVRCLAFVSTGGASAEVYRKEGVKNQLLESGYAYVSIFRELLKPYKKTK